MINWLKKNWLTVVVLFLVLSYFRKNSTFTRNFLPATGGGSYESMDMTNQAGYAPKNLSLERVLPIDIAPSSSADRLVIQDTSLSLQVKDVSQTISQIEAKSKQFGGFLVNSHLSKPELAATGNITIRVPSDKLQPAMEAFKAMSIKVVSESVNGRDVTDQYEDLSAKLAILNKTKLKFENILEQAVSVKDLLAVQRELVNLQSQIDSLKGRQDYLQKSADLSKIVIYLSTDDLSLPYAPTNAWRPIVIVKTAIRSLLTNLRSFGSLLIWSAVYSPLIGLAYLAYKFIYKKKKLS